MTINVIVSFDTDYIQSLLERLNKTRVRHFSFNVNGQQVTTTRRNARAAVVAEMSKRQAK